MAKVKVKWRPSKTAGKAGTIFYQIIHNRTARQITTPYKVYAEEWNAANSTIVESIVIQERAEVLSSIRERIGFEINRLKEIIGRLEKERPYYVASDVVKSFRAQSCSDTFFDVIRRVIAQKQFLDRHSTAVNYKMTLKSFAKFCKNKDILPCEINPELMARYQRYLMGRDVTKNTVSFYMRILRAVYNRAVEMGLTEQKYPFKNVYTGIDKTRKRAVNISAIKSIKNLDLTGYPGLDFSRDVFLFSFYTRGMSFIDIAYLKKTDLKKGFLVYRRRKTGQQLKIKWENCMQEIINKYRDINKHGETIDCPYLLPIIKDPGNDGYVQYKRTMQRINRSLKAVAKLAHLNIPLTMYVARHSWASIARSYNIPISVISEGLGHDSETTTQIYLTTLDTSVIDRANSRIIKILG